MARTNFLAARCKLEFTIRVFHLVTACSEKDFSLKGKMQTWCQCIAFGRAITLQARCPGDLSCSLARGEQEVSSRGLHLSCQWRKKSTHKHKACSNPARSIFQPFLLQPKGNSLSLSSSRLKLQVLGCTTPPRSPLPLISTQQQSKIAFPFFKGQDFWSFQAVISLVRYLGGDFSTKKERSPQENLLQAIA